MILNAIRHERETELTMNGEADPSLQLTEVVYWRIVQIDMSNTAQFSEDADFLNLRTSELEVNEIHHSREWSDVVNWRATQVQVSQFDQSSEWRDVQDVGS